MLFLIMTSVVLLSGKVTFGLQFKPRIVGGEATKKFEFPFMVSLQNSNKQHFCGGSLITLSRVLTAGHCLYSDIDRMIPLNARQLLVVAGISNLNDHGQTRHAKKLQPHKGFTKTDNDIGIVYLELEFERSDGVSLITPRTTPVSPGERCTVIGWGLMEFKGEKISDTLLKTKVMFVPHDQCSAIYSKRLSESLICAYQDEHDACQGDSGGPLICGGLLSGIVSRGKGCASKYPGLYTNVSYFRNWICNIENGGSTVKNNKPSIPHGLLSLLVGGYLYSRLIVELVKF